MGNHFSPEAWHKLFEERRPKPLSAPWWARGGHRQTILSHFLRKVDDLPRCTPESVQLDGSDQLAIRYYPGTTDTIVYLFHGLGGSADADYMSRATLVAGKRGFHVFSVNHRGCGEGAGLAREPYHSGRGEDLAAVIAHGRRKFPKARHLAVGFSLSGNALLLLLSGKRGVTKPDGAVAVNAPIALQTAAVAIKSGFNRVYDLRFVLRLRRSVRQRQAAGLEPEPYQIPPWATLHDFDNLYTAPAGGFSDREDYYHSCSTKDLLVHIQTPTVLMSSVDDPIVRWHDYAEAQRSASVYLHREQVGGHMGYLSANDTPYGSKFWLDYALDQYLVALNEGLRIRS
ncbi:YheT family hydrolase [Acanthopleuribacter pedis]|uniref:Alpha/beta fold hydrolase n=1 Tax=Acanthopleuribacter pedis TaxID=442870 RepID=A0A8J7QBT8_9BACT|nr:alpha/beta fold hydrolase [Acanthopleuribacter pedis]MBO1321567.1 alpha/beta fold hydrolase [Acanthopleuribacter pedis]